MSPRIRILARVHAARTRLRDVAAADRTEAEADRADKERRLEEERRREEDTITDVNKRLGLVRDVRELDAIRTELALSADAVRRAGSEVTRARMQSERASEVVRRKERELRSSEALLDRTRAARQRAMDREEQRATDDLVAARWGRNR